MDKYTTFRRCILVHVWLCMYVWSCMLAILPHIVELSSRRAVVQVHLCSTGQLTAVYSRLVKKRGFEFTTRTHPHLTHFSYLKSRNTFWCFVFIKSWFKHFNKLSISSTEALNLTSSFKNLFFVTYTQKKLRSNCSNTGFYETSCLSSKRGKIG